MIHWVYPFDCRYQKDGQALLILLPSEETEMVKVSVVLCLWIFKPKVYPCSLFFSLNCQVLKYCSRLTCSMSYSIFLVFVIYCNCLQESPWNNVDTTQVLIGQKTYSMGYSAGKHIENCYYSQLFFVKVIDRIFFGFTFVINPFGFLEWACDAGLPKENLVNYLRVSLADWLTEIWIKYQYIERFGFFYLLCRL